MLATKREPTRALNTASRPHLQGRHNTLFSVIFLYLWLQLQELRAHIGSQPSSRIKRTKMSQLLYLCYLSFSMSREHTMTLNQPAAKNNKVVTFTYSLLPFFLYGCNRKSREHTTAPNQRAGQKQKDVTTTFSLLPFFLYGCNHKSKEHTQWS
jgi:hypothetical protein